MERMYALEDTLLVRNVWDDSERNGDSVRTMFSRCIDLFGLEMCVYPVLTKLITPAVPFPFDKLKIFFRSPVFN